MGIGSLFRRKKKESLPKLPPVSITKPIPPKAETPLEKSTLENVKAKIDLMLTQIDSLKTQYETLNERLKKIEQMVEEIRSYYYR